MAGLFPGRRLLAILQTFQQANGKWTSMVGDWRFLLGWRDSKWFEHGIVWTKDQEILLGWSVSFVSCILTNSWMQSCVCDSCCRCWRCWWWLCQWFDFVGLLHSVSGFCFLLFGPEKQLATDRWWYYVLPAGNLYCCRLPSSEMSPRFSWCQDTHRNVKCQITHWNINSEH